MPAADLLCLFGLVAPGKVDGGIVYVPTKIDQEQ